jgi:hypothetical protein
VPTAPADALGPQVPYSHEPSTPDTGFPYDTGDALPAEHDGEDVVEAEVVESGTEATPVPESAAVDAEVVEAARAETSTAPGLAGTAWGAERPAPPSQAPGTAQHHPYVSPDEATRTPTDPEWVSSNHG